MIETVPHIVTAALLGGSVGGLVGWIGNYHVQNRIHMYFGGIEDLKRGFYNYLALSSKYWANEHKDVAKRRSLEAQIIVSQRIILTDYSLLRVRYRRLRKSYQTTKDLRTDLWDAVTGGCFQQQDWNPDHERVMRATNAVSRIVKSFY